MSSTDFILYESIIKGETSGDRFEKFCKELLEATEGISLVPTSPKWDRGRDGVSIRPTTGSHAEVLCCTISKSLESKVTADLKRLKESKTNPEHLYYCCSLELTEDAIDKLTADIRSFLPSGCSVAVLEARKLADRSRKRSETFRKYYYGEVRSAEAALQAFQAPGNSTETRGLRLALLAFASDDAQALRRQITTRAILDALQLCGACSASVLAQRLSSDLGLPKPLDSNYVQNILQHTCLEGFTAQISDGNWQLTANGEKEAKSVPPEAAKEILAGKATVKSALERLIGKSIADIQYDQIWSSLLDFFSEYFYSNGLAIISAVSAFLQGTGGTEQGFTSLEKVVEEGARKARSHILTAELGEQVEQAIKDIFMERSGPAFEWLSRLCERFVALCALGLEATSSDEVRLLLVKHRLMPDTDILVSVLCESEPDHYASREVIARFREIGGKVFLSQPVLEEVAYHAWISEREFKDNLHLFGKVGPEDLSKYVRNAFVRTFFLLAHQKKAKLEQWNVYIEQYRGITSHDSSKLLRILQTKLLAERLPDLMDEKFRKEATDYMKESAARSKRVGISQLGSDDVGKAETDGKVLGAIAGVRENFRQQGSEETLILLTSSGRLKRADQHFRSTLGNPDAVILPGAFSYLLSLVPSINLGISTLRRALFEFRDSGRLADTQKLALKVLKATEAYDLGWAERGTLERYLEESLQREADSTGQKVDTVRQKFVSGDESVRPAQLIFEALKEMAVSDKREEELLLAKKKIAELEDEIKSMTGKKRS
jgi:predicted nucleic acid-binding protein